MVSKLKNYKIFNIDEIVSLIMDFETIDKPSLQRLTANRLENVLSNMVESGEVESILVHSQDTYRRTNAYFYEEFNKMGQMRSSYSSYFTQYLTDNDFKFGTVGVDLATNNLRVPVFMAQEDGFFIVEAEVIPLRKGELGIFEEPNVINAIPAYVVEDRLIYADLIKMLTKTSIVIEKDTMIGFYLRVESGKKKSERLTKNHFQDVDNKIKKAVSNKQLIASLLKPYIEAEKREEKMQKKLVNGGYKGKK